MKSGSLVAEARLALMIASASSEKRKAEYVPMSSHGSCEQPSPQRGVGSRCRSNCEVVCLK